MWFIRRWRTDSVRKKNQNNACKSSFSTKIKQIGHMEDAGCDVSKVYLQYERHSCIHYDNGDQCHAPVVGNTHNLSGGRKSTECNTAHTLRTNINRTSQPLLPLSNGEYLPFLSSPPGSCRWQEQDEAWWGGGRYTDQCRTARTALKR